MTLVHAVLDMVFSTHVEMFLSQAEDRLEMVSFLHACGDVSFLRMAVTDSDVFSPRMWRCFLVPVMKSKIFVVFSTHVEILLSWICSNEICLSFFFPRTWNVSNDCPQGYGMT